MDKLKGQESVPVIEVLTQEAAADLQMTITAAVQRFKAVWQEEAVRSGSNRSANYLCLKQRNSVFKANVVLH